MAMMEEKRETTTRGGERELPQDVITEILLRLPINSLVRFKFVCKVWYDLIRSPDFISSNKNFNPKKKVSLYLRSYKYFPSNRSTTISFRVNKDNLDVTLPVVGNKLEIIGCSNGLVCLSISDLHGEFVILNPITGGFRVIPWLSSLYTSTRSSCGFCFDPIANTFKVVRIEFSSTHQRGTIEALVGIFSSGDNSWRTLGGVYPIGRSTTCNPVVVDQFQYRVTCVNRCMYWLIGNVYSYESLDDRRIICFDMVNELFKVVELPPCPPTILGSCFESLATFTCKDSYNFDVWVLDDCSGSNQSWTKKLTFTVPINLLLPIGFYGEDENNWDVVLSTHTGSYFLYDPQTGVTTNFSVEEYPNPLFAYSESIASGQ